ncbi:hypothetical protein GGI04_001527 [Coemansia thaxteri]|uniref:cytochrome-b5 reductase n=1 Tax=Coemansia thaxteri TaxID=2663907 RepID=A0A9W8BPC9_9FUNG|nr:hypothetical protein GGI04_001527 [Coemansia thaxteri]KAJ2007610.1 hypothetical protein H4R26_000689 [Coemansia thaxteri]KAJ2474058.1 hypothetical protein GGI02_000404 [Coemansia sp. RSA 2322]KAJ2486917.1 hypothetical protein EV174_000817 [Coemansia sp. RSA 2320]
MGPRILVTSNGYGGGGRRILVVGGLLAATVVGVNAYRFFNNQEPDMTLSRLRFTPIKLQSSTQLTHDVKRLTFALDNPNNRMGFTASSAVLFRVKLANGKSEWRPYTPVSTETQRGTCDFIIKRYDHGTVSPVMHGLEPGDQVEVWGPIPFIKYEPGKYQDVGLIAGGSGITPCLQLARRIVGDPSDHTRVTLLFSNKTADDVILKEELDRIAAQFPSKFSVHYIVDKPPAKNKWTGLVGRVDADVVEKVMPPAGKSTFIGICGPPGMVATISGDRPNPMAQGRIGGVLKELGYTNVFKF